jgi:CheY-like chemotaxis protein
LLKLRKIQKILLIDDDRITNYLNEKLLHRLDAGLEIVVKLNGKDALLYLQDTEVFPSLIFLDINMPGLNAFDFIEEFKRLGYHNKDTVIVILTISDDVDDMIRLKYLGKYGYLNKPLTEEKVLGIYNDYFKGGASGKFA